MTSREMSGERGSASSDDVVGWVGEVGVIGGLCGLQAMSVTSDAGTRRRRMVMRLAAARPMPLLRAGARSPCYNRAVASRSQTEQQQQTSVDIAEVLKELEIKIERLKVLYEQYFMGIEKIEPMVTRKEVTRAMLLLQQQQIRNTGLRFKFNTMLQKWNIYTTYWNRTLREIENGTYTRHIQRARRVAARKQAGEGAVSYDALVNSLAKQVPRVLQQPGVKGVRFEVGMQNGKAILKAFPTK